MTETQHQANIANAQKSTGPRTEAGKRRSSLCARRHQLTSKVYIAPPDEMAAFTAHCAAFKAALAPVGTLEESLAEEIAHDRWRLKRARAIENSIFAQGHADHVEETNTGRAEVDGALAEGQTWLDHAPSLALLSIYENRIRRAIEKNQAELRAMQADRKAAYDRARNDAIRLAQLAESEDEEYDPGNDFVPASAHGGFVFSAPELLRFVDRRQRIDRARRHASGRDLHSAADPQAA